MVDLLLADIAKMEREEQLKQWHHLHALQMSEEHKPGWRENFLLGLSRWLIKTGEQLRQRAELHLSLR